jgi:hypothetical protein
VEEFDEREMVAQVDGSFPPLDRSEHFGLPPILDDWLDVAGMGRILRMAGDGECGNYTVPDDARSC